MTATLDDTRGYGKIFELEVMTDAKHQGEAHKKLRQRFSDLGIQPKSRKDMERAYRYYQRNWKKLIRA
ncbi:MAG: hypothetical protein HYT40_01935 [Candidatus Sungbacteria bacterium]|uniref:CYTH domain-containing protein n=1 Tax=Candidatus Sungiibacteriota bacterium TaxID=2750080 RepID=A0A931WN31_9BACT|nr:hypothetical protein [Candidatus Sungbacteria bacterium]